MVWGATPERDAGAPAGHCDLGDAFVFLTYLEQSELMANRSTHRGGNVLFFLSSHVQGKTWSEVVEIHQKLPTDQSDLRKQQEAVWELFTSECTYFLDHLLVLKMVMLGLVFVVDGKH